MKVMQVYRVENCLKTFFTDTGKNPDVYLPSE